MKEGISIIKYLSECKEGEFVVLIVNAGIRAKRRLANLGLVPGVRITLKRAAPFRGPIQILVKGSALVIGRGLANKILVKNESYSIY